MRGEEVKFVHFSLPNSDVSYCVYVCIVYMYYRYILYVFFSPLYYNSCISQGVYQLFSVTKCDPQTIDHILPNRVFFWYFPPYYYAEEIASFESIWEKTIILWKKKIKKRKKPISVLTVMKQRQITTGFQPIGAT